MQFMSQSTCWPDNLILAMAPLGIVTAIVASIRVGGPPWLKAIIGRAMESRAAVEAELMSSTSNEVCELCNGQDIVRVAGRGPIREFIVLTPEGSGGTVRGAAKKNVQPGPAAANGEGEGEAKSATAPGRGHKSDQLEQVIGQDDPENNYFIKYSE